MFGSFGFSGYDLALLCACTIGALVGSLVQAMVLTISLDGPPNDLSTFKIAPPEIRAVRSGWLTLRMFIGGVLGFVFGLYFVGMLHETPATFAKIWALSFIVGYAAPRIWLIKEEAAVKAAKAGRFVKPVE